MSRQSYIDLQQRDAKVLWHPYAGTPVEPLPYVVREASGLYLTLEDGRRLLDGMSSWWAVIHGYNHPELNRALTDQLERVAHVMFGGLTHEPAVLLAEKLISLTPAGLERVFFSDSGSVSVEVAVKMAVQYWIGRGRPRKKRLLSLLGGYHGDTFAAMSLCDPVNGMHHLFSDLVMPQYFSARPEIPFAGAWKEEAGAELERAFAEHHQELAAIILEPIVQGAGGMWFYHPEYLRLVRKLCDHYEVLLIADEIATGFGRSGEMFACQHAGISPDILCLGKALTGGYMSFAATLTREEIARVISAGETGILMHGPTFMANPLACAVARASLELLEHAPWRKRVARIEKELEKGLAPCRRLPGVRDVRTLGAIGVVECEQPVPVGALQEELVDRGVWLRPFARLCYTMPPLIAEAADIAKITSAMEAALNAVL